jgi:uncharacterized membrane protein YtjA (UPF0391 family)
MIPVPLSDPKVVGRATRRLQVAPTLNRRHGGVPTALCQEPVPPSEVREFDGAAAAHGSEERALTILKWALIFFLVSVVAGVLGFTGISAATADIARFLFYIFVVIFLVLLILGLTIFRV